MHSCTQHHNVQLSVFIVNNNNNNNNNNKTCTLIDVAIPTDRNVVQKKQKRS